jgi:hypothetical protein
MLDSIATSPTPIKKKATVFSVAGAAPKRHVAMTRPVQIRIWRNRVNRQEMVKMSPLQGSVFEVILTHSRLESSAPP